MTNQNNAKRGRPTKNYISADGTEHKGLYRRSDGRWIIKQTGLTFTQPDERLAVMRFLRETAASRIETLGINSIPIKQFDESESWTMIAETIQQTEGINHIDIKVTVDSDVFWRYVRECFITRTAYVAQRTGLPQLINFADMALPGKSAKFDDLITSYGQKNNLKKESLQKAKVAVEEFSKIVGVSTLRDVTTDMMKVYREKIKRTYTAPSTIAGRFRKIKTVVNYGLKEGFDASDIRSFLDRAKVLHIDHPKAGIAIPNPISQNDFNLLLSGASVELRAVLLLALNCCMYLSEVLVLKWNEINLDKKFLITTRLKMENKQKIIRTATLWDETIDAMKALKRKGMSPYIFTSLHGSKYNSKSYLKKFNRLRETVGAIVEFNQIRDGAYTSAAENEVSFGACQVLAGHKLPGDADHYVARLPKLVRPACEVIYSVYSPFSDSVNKIKIGRPKKF